MVRKKPKATPPERALFLGLTPNQVVAYNLARARELKGWTQDQAAEALEPYLGARWSKASVSQAERSVAGGFVRNFTADEIVAFARAFDQPVTWFFMPPPPWAGPGMPAKLAVPDAPAFGQALTLLVDLVFGDEVGQAQLVLRLDAFLDEVGPDGLTEAQARVASLARQRMAALGAPVLRRPGPLADLAALPGQPARGPRGPGQAPGGLRGRRRQRGSPDHYDGGGAGARTRARPPRGGRATLHRGRAG